jgi:hypothetical protein
MPAVVGSGRLNAFRLNYLPVRLRAIRETRVLVAIGGVLVRARVRRGSLTIHDVLNDAPNTAAWTMDGTPAPTVGQPVRITLNTNTPRILFTGAIETTAISFDGRPIHPVWACTATDDTARADHHRPFGLYAGVSASSVATDLVTRFAPGLTAAHVQAGLTPVTVAFDGTEGFNGCLRAIAKIIGGYFYWEDGDLHFFLSEPTEAPAAITPTTPTLLYQPPITATTDDSQLRTRVLGRGWGSTLLCDVLAGETILPLEDTTLYTATGGRLVGAVTSDGSLTERGSYTSAAAAGGGTLIGPGVGPTAAPSLRVVAGGTLPAGTYTYAYTDVTASGESLPGPSAAIAVTGVTPPPTTAAPALVQLVTGAGVDVGTHDYVLTGVTATGETTPGPIGPVVTVPAPVANPTAPTIRNDTGGGAASSWAPGDALYAAVAYVDAADAHTTLATGAVNGVTATTLAPGLAHCLVVPLVASPDPRVTAIRVYIRRNGTWIGYTTATNATFDGVMTGVSAAGDPTTLPHTLTTQQVYLSLPIADAACTQRKLYRRVGGAGPFKLALIVADNTSVNALDLVANSALGAAAPATNTATAAQVEVSGIAIGPGATTARKLYRTVVNGAALKLQQTIANNTATTGALDTTADAALGAAAPTGDTSGFTQPAGQVIAGAAQLPTAGAGPFAAAGGWAVAPNGQTIRYTGITGNTLTGIPASGPGAITTTLPYGTALRAAPVLRGVVGVTQPWRRGARVQVFVQRDDLDAQAAAAAREATATTPADGIHEAVITDDRRGEPSLTARCDADLALFKAPIVTVAYDSRDVLTKSGKPVSVNLPELPIVATLVIQDVTISELDVADGLAPRFAVRASTVQFSLEDLLRQLSALLPDESAT